MGSPASAAAASAAAVTTVGMPAAVAIRAESTLVDMPPVPTPDWPVLPALTCVQVLGSGHHVDPAGAALSRVSVVEAVHVGEQDQRARPGDVGDQGG